jgi:hypothetical protein
VKKMSTTEPSGAAGASAAADAAGAQFTAPHDPHYEPRATSHYLTRHGSTAAVGATVHGFTVGCWWAAGVFWAAADLCSALIRGGTRLHHEAGQPEPLDEIVSGLI